MELAVAIADFLRQSAADLKSGSSLRLLIDHFGEDAQPGDLTAERLRNFLGHWYIARTGHCRSGKGSESATGHISREEIERLFEDLARFLEWWAMKAIGVSQTDCRRILEEARAATLRAVEIGEDLAKATRQDHGAFAFSEFLTTFEEGGRSEYDLDSCDSNHTAGLATLEGYFRIADVEGNLVQAIDMLTEEQVGPIAFPSDVVALLDRDYVVELELVRDGQRWAIAGCGFAYPPGAFNRQK